MHSNQIVHLLLLTTGITLTHCSSSDFNKRLRRAVVDPARQHQAALDHSIIDNETCEDIKNACSYLKAFDNLSVLECLNKFTTSQLEALPDKCQHTIWEELQKLQSSKWVQERILPIYCEVEQKNLATCFNIVTDLWSCIREKLDQIPHDNKCRIHLRRINGVLFEDHENINDFVSACKSEIDQLECGRLNTERKPVSQLETVQCLMETGSDILGKNCKMAIERIDQQKHDLEFFDICAIDIQRLCQEHIGTAGAFKCLVKNKANPSLSRRCFEQITQRDTELAKDYRVSHGLAKSCKDDIKINHCRRGVSEDKHVRLAQILLCLESVAKNGTKITPECRAEIDDHRKMLMQDYHLSPEILSDCADDIPKFCGEISKIQSIQSNNGEGGEIIHCLLEHARAKRRRDGRVTAQCQRSLETLIKVSDAGEDWRVDPVLRRACKPVVDAACRDTDGGDARVMSCLMERIGTPVMRPNCEQALLLIQYFVARDFKLDPQLYKHCRDDAIKYCKAKKAWDDVTDIQMDPERGPMILPCLHRIAYNENPRIKLREDCFAEVKRVMRQRAISVDLMPEIEDACIEDLSQRCFDQTEKGAEMDCLQNNLDKLQPECKEAVSKFTEEEAGHVELNSVIMSLCMEAMQTHCSSILKGGKDKGDMMECLIAHKNDPDLRQNLKCRAAIEHFQIISLKNYHFTYKFKEACRPHVQRFCTASTTKNEVVACLSEVMRNDTIKGQRHSIPKECRQQVKAQLYQQRETVALDPKLAHACERELDEFCSDEKGPGQVNKNAIECLSAHTHQLGNDCHHAIFLIKKSELGDSDTDYTLVNTCKEMTYKYCPNTDSLHLLECLKTYKDDPTFDKRCHLVVVNRMIEQNTDFRFNPNLQMACGKNIDQYCSKIVATAQPNEELNGKVVQCLKTKFRESKLDLDCSKEMIKILKEQALNYKLNPILQNFCEKEIKVLCKMHMENEEHGLVEECLRTAFLNQKIINPNCRMEVATLIAEAKADIHVDPILEEACTVDLLRYCADVKSGNGRKLKCLKRILQDQSKAMDIDCRKKLQRRMEMFRNADSVLAQPPENVEQLVNQVITSPAKKFFIVILMSAIGMVFMMGIFLGRVSKRAILSKNK